MRGCVYNAYVIDKNTYVYDNIANFYFFTITFVFWCCGKKSNLKLK